MDFCYFTPFHIENIKLNLFLILLKRAFIVDEVNAILKEVESSSCRFLSRNCIQRSEFIIPHTPHLKKSIESTVQNAVYHHNKVGQWNSNIVETALKKLSGLNKPFKYVITCTIMQRNGAGLHASSSCYWDNATDGNSFLLLSCSWICIRSV